MQKQQNLSKNQQIIFDIIHNSSEPLKAYSILFNVQKKGIKAPLQVYRALDKLVALGKIHKIESRNAFVACKNSNCEISKTTAFSICEKCEKVTELEKDNLKSFFGTLSNSVNFEYSDHNLEIFGFCNSCR